MSRIVASETRKQHTREKFELGGLIIKAGFRHQERALLLGLLIDAGRWLREDETERSRLRRIGNEALGNAGK